MLQSGVLMDRIKYLQDLYLPLRNAVQIFGDGVTLEAGRWWIAELLIFPGPS